MTKHHATQPFNPRRILAAALLLLAATGISLAQSDSPAESASWELRVCAPPNSMPFSHVDGTGFENRIAELLADELNAELVYNWRPFNADLINRQFSEGTCDVIIGVPDGFEKSLNTISYYQSPFVSVQRADADFELQSMDDPILHDLNIAVQGTGTPPHEALLVRALHGNVTQRYGTEDYDDSLGVMVNAVADGLVDVGFGWGPVVNYYAERSDVEFIVAPIEPMFDLPSIFQVQPMAMAVRPHDYAMQARLNRAIAARWDDINAILAEYDIPVMPSAAPGAPAERDMSRTLRIGAVLPVPTGAGTVVAKAYDLIGDAARQGAQLAESLASQSRGSGEIDVVLLLASSPSASAAEQQVRAMVALDEVDALIGGVGSGQAEVLARVAEEAGIPFINIGSTSLALREQCRATTFHVQPSAAVYLGAVLEQYGLPDGATDWYIVYEDNDENALNFAAAGELISAAGDTLVGSAAVSKSRPVYHDLFAEAEELQADGVMLLLDPADQLAFIGQAEDAGYDLNFAPFPDPLIQTREFLAAGRRYGVGLEIERLQLWDPTLASERAADLNERFAGQWGLPLDAPAWVAIQAVTALTEAARQADSTEAEQLISALYDVDAGAAAGKDASTYFDAADRELPQTLYVVGQNLDNTWGIRLSQQINAGILLAEIAPAAVSHGEVCP